MENSKIFCYEIKKKNSYSNIVQFHFNILEQRQRLATPTF